MYLRKSIVLVLLFFSGIATSYSQVLVQDSLALVSLYNSTGGSTWTNKTNWLTGPVSTWTGIMVNSGRVNSIILDNNNLVGTFPAELCDLTELLYLDISENSLSGTIPTCIGNFYRMNTIDLRNNNFTGSIPASIISCTNLGDLFITNNNFDQLPSLLSIPEITNVLIENNQFTFEDIEPNMGLFNFLYSPQDSIYSILDTVAEIHDTISFAVVTGGTQNIYQWFFNGEALINSAHIQGANGPVLTINKLALSDSGTYTCRITNSLATFLTLFRWPIHLQVNDTRTDQQLFFPPLAPIVCGAQPVKLGAVTTSGLSINYTVLSGMANLILPDTIQPLMPGSITVRAFQAGDDTYKPVSKDTTLTVLLPAMAGSIFLSTNLPLKKNDTLQFSATMISGAQYSWTSPLGSMYNSNAIVIPGVTENDNGYYKISVGSFSCIYFTDSVYVVVGDLESVYVYELITPNQDGKNETFYIRNIDQYSDNEVIVYNSWGQIVYKAKTYTNDWSGDDLPSGTYYYFVTIPSIDFTGRGSLYIRK